MVPQGMAVALALAALCCAGLASNSAEDVLSGFLTFPLQNISAGAEAPDNLFTIIFVSDSEPRMRGNTDHELSEYIANLVSYKTTREEKFDYEGGTHRIDPLLVILGGDISKDRDTSIVTDAPLWQTLADNDIAFLAGFGNHDWESFAPTSYTVTGDTSNSQVTEFCRSTYFNASVKAAPHFGYREFGPSDLRGPVTSVASFRGVQVVNFNSFLYQPAYHYDFDSARGQACKEENVTQGWAGCQVFSSAEPQIQELEVALNRDAGTPTIFVQHYPLSTHDSWWEDGGVSGTTLTEKKNRLKDLIGRYNGAVLLSGHNHAYARHEHTSPSGGRFIEYVAPYFGGGGGMDLNIGGGFLALLVSRTQGIVEVKHLAAPLYDPARTRAPTPQPSEAPVPTPPPSELTPLPTPIDLSILGENMDKDVVEACILENCAREGIQCAGDSTCFEIGGVLILQKDTLDAVGFARVAHELRANAETNSAIQAVSQCSDTNCGTRIVELNPEGTPQPTPAPGPAPGTPDAGAWARRGRTPLILLLAWAAASRVPEGWP